VQDVLHLEHVGIADNLFDLGANSVHVVQMHGRLRDALHRDVSIVDLFKHPSIEALSAYLSQSSSADPAVEQGYARAEARRAALQRRTLPHPDRPSKDH